MKKLSLVDGTDIVRCASHSIDSNLHLMKVEVKGEKEQVEVTEYELDEIEMSQSQIFTLWKNPFGR